MLNALAAGQIVREPKHGTSANGNRWANATIRCSTGTDKEGAALTSFINVVAFGDTADKLSKLDKGDSISVQGSLKQTEYATDGGTRHGLEILAASILTAYQIRQKRGDHAPSGTSSRDQTAAYKSFAKRAIGGY